MKTTSPFRLIAAALLLMALAHSGPVSAATITWTNSAGGDWATAGNWSPQQVPGAGDSAIISGTAALSIRVDGDQSVGTLSLVNPNAILLLKGSQFTSQALLTVASGFVNQGIIELSSEDAGYESRLTVTTGTLTNAVGGVIRAVEGAGGPRNLNSNLDNRGTLAVERDLTLNGNVANSGTVQLPAGKTLTIPSATTWTHRASAITGTGTLSLANGSTFALEEDFTPGGFVLNAPNLTVNGPAKLLGPATGEFLIRNWTINAGVIVSGDLRIDGVVSFNSPLAVSAGKTLRVKGSQFTSQALLTVASGFVNQGIIELSSEDAGYESRLTVTTGTLTNAVGGVIRAVEGAGGPRNLNSNLDNRGTLLVSAGVTLNLNGTLLNTASGVLGGTGTFDFASATVVNDGTVAPGASPGILSVSGNLPWNPSALFDVEIAGFTAGTHYDRLVISSPVSFNGTIRAGLINGFFPKKDDAFTVLTYPSRTGTFTTLSNPLPERIAYREDYGATSAQIVVLNTAPTLAAIVNQTVNELVQLSVTASATDQDLPAQTMTYSLNTAPLGMTINPSSGQITWTSTEAQGPGNYNVTVRVTDNGTPALGHTTSFSVTVNEINVPPVLSPLANTNVNELTTLTLTNSATDIDIPVNTLTYALIASPPGATIDTNGVITWTPTEAQGPGTNTFTTVVTDTNILAVNTQSFTVTNTFTVVVNEVNVPPVLTLPANQTINELVAFGANATATDADLPVNPLRFALVSGPAGLTVSAAGFIAWTPGETQGPSTNTVVISVTDTNPPAINATSLSVTGSFELVVREVNTPPVLTLPVATNANELVAFTASATASDSDNPTNALTFALVSGPAGLTVSSVGLVNWTPAEDQGPGTNTVTLSVTDTNPISVNATSLSVTSSFQIVVNEVNAAPVITPFANPNINELVPFTATVSATDADQPVNPLTFARVSGPVGLTVSPTGVINWTPAEHQGPSTNTVTFSVTDTNPIAVNATSLSVTSSVEIVVNEVNVAPVLGTLINRTVNPGKAIGFTATATDADLPTNTLSYSLVSPPSGANINSTSGVFSWRPGVTLAGATNVIQVRVQDNGAPVSNDVKSFTVIINAIAPVVLTPVSYSNGQFQFQVSGPWEPDYVIMASTNLVLWTDVSTNLSPATPFMFTDDSAGRFTNRAYRVRLAP